jgi:hypothetical protein
MTSPELILDVPGPISTSLVAETLALVAAALVIQILKAGIYKPTRELLTIIIRIAVPYCRSGQAYLVYFFLS